MSQAPTVYEASTVEEEVDDGGEGLAFGVDIALPVSEKTRRVRLLVGCVDEFEKRLTYGKGG